MEAQRSRIETILGKQMGKNARNTTRYLGYLKSNIALPCRLTGVRDFPWEADYMSTQWKSAAYEEIQRDKPSFLDEFDLLELLPPADDDDDIVARVQRCQDLKVFELGLSWLECTDFDSDNFQLLDDYAVWYRTYGDGNQGKDDSR